MTQEYVIKFCKVCDFYRGEEPCHAVGECDQERYASRNWCGWAMISGVKAEVTMQAVKVHGQKIKRENDEEIRRSLSAKLIT